MMVPRASRVGAALVLFLSVASGPACRKSEDGPSEAGSSSPVPGATETSAAALPDTADFYAALAAPTLASYAFGKMESAPVTAKGEDAARVYRTVGPSTVVIRLDNGHGSGVLLHPAKEGWVLTNAHVVAGARRNADGQREVEVELGKLTGGVIERPESTLRGIIHLSSEEKDLALVKLTDVPKGAIGAKFADEAPTPGATLVVMGHGGVGFLWQVRECDVSSVGSTGKSMAVVPSVCMTAERYGAEHAAKCNAMLARTKGKMRDTKLIQSSCDINSGDSGGPVFDAKGRLVGVNSFYISNPDPQRRAERGAFHIHLDEARRFTKMAMNARREAPRRGGVAPADGPEAVMAVLREAAGVTIALGKAQDGTELLGVGVKPVLEPGKPGRTTVGALRPRLLLLAKSGQPLTAVYDADGDGAPEVRLAGPRQPVAGAVRAQRYRGGKWVDAPADLGRKLISAELLEASVHPALAELFPPHAVQAKGASRYPDPIRDVGRFVGAKKIGVSIAAAFDDPPAKALFVDLDGDTEDVSSPKEAQMAVKDGAFDDELVVIAAGSQVWALADMDGEAGPEAILFGDTRKNDAVIIRGDEVERTDLNLCPLGASAPAPLRAALARVVSQMFNQPDCK